MIPTGPGLGLAFLAWLADRFRDFSAEQASKRKDEEAFVREALKPGAGIEVSAPEKPEESKLHIVK